MTLSSSASLRSQLEEKRNRLSEVNQTLTKIAGPRPAYNNGNQQDGGGGGQVQKRFANRLGPPTQGAGYRPNMPLGRRLGPKVNDGGAGDDDGEKSSLAMMSRVQVGADAAASCEAALKELGETKDKTQVTRNRRMFGNLLGTLARFRADETRVKAREEKKRVIIEKIEEKTEKEREEAIQQKRDLFMEKERQQKEIRVLQVRKQNSRRKYAKAM